MAFAPRLIARRCPCSCQSYLSPSIRATSLVTFSPSQKRKPLQSRWQSTEASTAGGSAGNPKIETIVEQISQLTLLETADLVSTLKSRLNIPDIPMGGFAPPPGAQGAVAAAPAIEEDEPAPKAEEKTLFNVKLESFDAAAKPKVIKEIKQLLGLSLVDSKKFVESAPKVMKESVPKDEGEKIMETLKGLGAVVVME